MKKLYTIAFLLLTLISYGYASPPLVKVAIEIPDEISVGASAQFKGTCTDCTDKVYNWQWDFGDGKPLSTTKPQASHTYSKQGKYTITLVVDNDIAHKAVVEITVMPRKVIDLVPEAVITPSDKTKELREALTIFTKDKNIYELAKHLKNVNMQMPITVDNVSTTFDAYLSSVRTENATIANIIFKTDSFTHAILSLDILTK